MRGVVKAAVDGMRSHYGCKPENIVAGIGPSIGVDHYEVGSDVILQFQEKYKHDADKILQVKNESTFLDLWSANAIQLRDVGVEQIQISGICTACHLEDWYSHRAEKGKTGRFGALMAGGFPSRSTLTGCEVKLAHARFISFIHPRTIFTNTG
jgi:copper oxidase (laccase) domain-containing protein